MIWSSVLGLSWHYTTKNFAEVEFAYILISSNKKHKKTYEIPKSLIRYQAEFHLF